MNFDTISFDILNDIYNNEYIHYFISVIFLFVLFYFDIHFFEIIKNNNKEEENNDEINDDNDNDIDIEDIANKYGEKYLDNKDKNPYYFIDESKRKRDNAVYDMDSIIKPIGKNINDDKLKEFMRDLLLHKFKTARDFMISKSKVMKKHKINPRKTELFYIYQIMVRDGEINDDDDIKQILQSSSHRSQSGVMVYAVITHPFWKEEKTGKEKSFSCKYDCAYCPEQPARPRSYVDGEPGLDRAHSLGYSTKNQVYSRASTYKINGHVNDKAEVIVLGGTWHSYPLEYRKMFMNELYYAFNTIYGDRDRKMKSLEEEIKINQSNSKCRVIGLTIETRPDQIKPKELKIMRKMGITRIQIGVQHINDRILTRIKRQCSNNQTIKAIRLLKDNGFKVDIHLMPDLPKPFTKEFELKNKDRINKIKNDEYDVDDIDWNVDMVEEDKKMFDEVFYGTNYCPDQLKIYPFEVMDWTSLKKDYERGLHKSYGEIKDNFEDNILVEMLIHYMSNMPKWIRVNRVIRDIPESYILGGIKSINGRQILENIMNKRGIKATDIRGREIKKEKINPSNVKLDVIEYDASGGKEFFIQFITTYDGNDPIEKFKRDDKIIGFLRLRLSKNSGYHTINDRKKEIVFDKLINCAMIRELHVYGQTTKVKSKDTKSQQHMGYGSKLLMEAFKISKEYGYNKISVIAGEGVKKYYEKFGFVDDEYFMFKDL